MTSTTVSPVRRTPTGNLRLTVLQILTIRAAVQRATRHHLRATLGGPVGVRLAMAGAAVVVIGINAASYYGLGSFIGPLLEDPASAALFGPLFAVSFCLGAYGLTLIFLVLLPRSSPILLQARMAGVSRWVAAVGELLPKVSWIAAFALCVELGGILFVAQLSPLPVATFIGVSVAAVTSALGCLAAYTVFARALLWLRVGEEIARIGAVLGASLLILAVYLNLMQSVDTALESGSQSGIAALFDLWSAEGTRAAVVGLGAVAALVGVLALTVVFSLTDESGGILTTRTRLAPIPRTSSRLVNTFLREVVWWLREPVTKLALSCALALGTLIVLGVRAGALDPGIGMLLLVIMISAGGEVLLGRTLDTSWIYTVSGRSPLRQYASRVVPVGSFQLLLLLAGLLLMGTSAGMLLAEALGLFLAVQAIAVLAGAILPFTHKAGMGMASTSLLALCLELLFLALEGVVLRPDGAAGIALNVVAACLIHGAAARMYRRRLSASV